MPHAPGQEPGFLRRNMVLAVGFGARHIDNFWIGPEERFTENYVAWKYKDTFRVLSESIYDSAEVEEVPDGGEGAPGPGRDPHEQGDRLQREPADGALGEGPVRGPVQERPERNQPDAVPQEQQMLYLALRHAQHAVDCITEEEHPRRLPEELKVVYFAGEWIDNRVIPKLEEWVKAGGVLYCCAGCGHKNQYDESEPAMLKLLGLKSITTTKNAYHLRTLLELPLCEPIASIWTLGGNTSLR